MNCWLSRSSRRAALFLVACSFAAVIGVFGVPTVLWGWQASHVSTSPHNMVATVNPIATDAAVEVLKQGGNAVDAAITAGLMLTVVDSYNSGIGGGCFILIRTADGQVIAIDGREMAPAAAHRDMYLVDGEPDPQLSRIGPLAIGVPGALKAYEDAVVRFGKRDFRDLVKPAARVAREGFELPRQYAALLKANRDKLARFPGTRQALLKEDGSAWETGEVLVQTDLANTLDRISREGTDYFYHGEFAQKTGEWMAENGGILTAEDFANYHTVTRKPVRSTYRGYEILGFPPPSSGGVHVAQILNIVESFDLKELHRESPADYVHVVAEAMKLAFADRAYWLGDADFADVPKGLIDKKYAQQLAKRINLEQVTDVESHGTPPRADAEFFEKHTTHITAADDQGNWVAITSTVNTSFGSKVIVPGLGVAMNNQMDDFSIAPGVPNIYGLVGSEANSVQPGKRPLSSMSPTIVLKDGQPVMTVGAAGGPTIISQACLAIIRWVDLGRSLDEAVAQKRFHHQWSPDQLVLERGFDMVVAGQLKSKGHRLSIRREVGITQAIQYDPDRKRFIGVHDPRTEGKAAGEDP